MQAVAAGLWRLLNGRSGPFAGGSYQVAEGFFRADHPAGGEGFFGATGVNLIGDEAVLLIVNLGKELEPELGELGLVEAAFEDAVLDADAEVSLKQNDRVQQDAGAGNRDASEA